MTKENKKLLEGLYLKYTKINYPSFPEYAIPMEKFSDATANDLTKTICKFITYIDGQAERISNQGQFRKGTKTITDVLGRKRTIGTDKWTKGAGTNGTADISAVIPIKQSSGTIIGLSVKIEVKIKFDRQSAEQKRYQENIEKVGGVYIIAKDFDQFLEDFRKIYIKYKN
jgi:hypothetical protein